METEPTTESSTTMVQPTGEHVDDLRLEECIRIIQHAVGFTHNEILHGAVLAHLADMKQPKNISDAVEYVKTKKGGTLEIQKALKIFKISGQQNNTRAISVLKDVAAHSDNDGIVNTFTELIQLVADKIKQKPEHTAEEKKGAQIDEEFRYSQTHDAFRTRNPRVFAHTESVPTTNTGYASVLIPQALVHHRSPQYDQANRINRVPVLVDNDAMW
jgi:hypothetical protein